MPPDPDLPTPAPHPTDPAPRWTGPDRAAGAPGAAASAGATVLHALFAEVGARPDPSGLGRAPTVDPALAPLHAELVTLYAGMLAATARLDRDGHIDPDVRAAAIAALHELRAALREIERRSVGDDPVA